MASLTFKNVNKIYSNGYQAVTDFNLEVDDGEFIVFVGPSGCGKSTTLRMISGLEGITSGELYIDDQLVNNLSPSERDIAMVFQNYALYSHMTVYENIGFGLTVKKINENEKHEAILKASEITALDEELNKKPASLSGGQRQRVALGRAIVRDTNLFLLDEPLSNLDAKLRASTRHELMELKEKIKSTMIYVTHDQIEAMTMADRIVIMNQGVTQQIASPREMYEFPENVFVATFLGSPAMNVIKLNLLDKHLVIEDNKVLLPGSIKCLLDDYVEDTIYLGIRPENISNTNLKLKQDYVLEIKTTVEEVELLGDAVICAFYLEENKIYARLEASDEIKIGDTISIGLDLNKAHLFDSKTECRLRRGM